MPYVQRDAHGNIVGIFNNPQPGTAEDYEEGEFELTELYSDVRLGEYIRERTEIEITAGGHTVLNDDLTRARLQQKQSALLLKPEGTTIKWQVADGSFVFIGIDVIQALFAACDDWQQKCFDAAEVVAAANQSSPFLNWAGAKAVFDAEMEE